MMDQGLEMMDQGLDSKTIRVSFLVIDLMYSIDPELYHYLIDEFWDNEKESSILTISFDIVENNIYARLPPELFCNASDGVLVICIQDIILPTDNAITPVWRNTITGIETPITRESSLGAIVWFALGKLKPFNELSNMNNEEIAKYNELLMHSYKNCTRKRKSN